MTGDSPQGQGSGSLEEALRMAERLPEMLAGILEAAPPAWLEEQQGLRRSDGPGGVGEPGADSPWGPRAVVEHLLDVEDIAFVGRIRRIVEEDDPFIRSIDPPARLAAGGDRNRSLTEVLAELTQRRAADVAWVRTLTPEQLDRTGTHDVAGTISARQLVHYWGTHDLLHVGQLVAALRANLVPHIGGMTAFLED